MSSYSAKQNMTVVITAQNNHGNTSRLLLTISDSTFRTKNAPGPTKILAYSLAELGRPLGGFGKHRYLKPFAERTDPLFPKPRSFNEVLPYAWLLAPISITALRDLRPHRALASLFPGLKLEGIKL
ncbi:hypothetical protein L218DRAFT_945781 [Marasmius fiardii PR-910]|nr:hypothetical protein L218DRAFT_945781 [Marasmius fiardii PR-910]